MTKILAAIIFVLMTGSAAAENSPEVDEGIASIKQKKFDFNAESRIFIEEAAPEFLLRYKNISADWIHGDDKNFLKLKADKEIFSLMGTGLEWNISLNAVEEKILPSVGINIYMRIRPRLDIYLEFSGLTLGRHGHVSDFESGIKYFPQKNFSVSAGWREINFKRHDKFNLRGVFAGVRYDF